MSQHKYAIGIDIGGTRTKLAVIRDDGEVLTYKIFLTTDFPKAQDFVEELKKTIFHLMTFVKTEAIQLDGIGIGAPNAHRESGVMINPPNFDWGENLALTEILQSTFTLPIILENDACIAGYGEAVWGAALGLDRFVVVTLGTGVGVCTFIDGKAVKSVAGLNGEFGHIALYPDGRECACGGRGHLEKYLSVQGIVQTVSEMTQQDWNFKEILNELEQPNPHPQLLEALDKSAEDLGRSLSFLHLLIGPELFILAGGGSLLGDTFTLRVQHYLRHFTFTHFKNHPRVVRTQLASDLGAVAGAAGLIFKGNN